MKMMVIEGIIIPFLAQAMRFLTGADRQDIRLVDISRLYHEGHQPINL
jgi:hypothetical protein